MENQISNIHIGAIIKRYLAEKNIAQAVVARRLQIDDRMVVYYLNRPHFSTKKLLQFSELLQRNLFADIAQKLPESFTKPPTESNKDPQRIAQLEFEIELLKSQLNLLKEMIRKE